MTAAVATGRHHRPRITALIEDVEWLLGGREWPPRVAERLGYSTTSLAKALYRAGRKDLAARFEECR